MKDEKSNFLFCEGIIVVGCVWWYFGRWVLVGLGWGGFCLVWYVLLGDFLLLLFLNCGWIEFCISERFCVFGNEWLKMN